MKNYSLLFIKDSNSKLVLNTELINKLFKNVEIIENNSDAILEKYNSNSYDVVIGDLTVKLDHIIPLKKIKNDKEDQIIFTLVDPKDKKRLFSISEIGIHAIELTASQFDQALEMIAEFEG